MPSELDGRVTFQRRILQRTSSLSSDTEPVGTAFLQLLRPASDADCRPREAVDRVGRWPGVLSVSCWRSAVTTPDTSRREVVHLRDAELLLAELNVDDRGTSQLLAHAADQLPGWEASAYRQAYPARGVLLPARLLSARKGPARNPRAPGSLQ